ncbi:MAG: hypothetical protein ACK5PR_03630 [bacterium]|jgi:hypothetical protein
MPINSRAKRLALNQIASLNSYQIQEVDKALKKLFEVLSRDIGVEIKIRVYERPLFDGKGELNQEILVYEVEYDKQ